MKDLVTLSKLPSKLGTQCKNPSWYCPLETVRGGAVCLTEKIH